MDERQAPRLRHRLQVLVVGHDGHEIGVEAAGPPAEDQVVEAVPHLRHHHQHALRAVVRQLELHRELVGHLGPEGRGQLRGVGITGGDELGSQEERMPDGVVELAVLDDVAAVLEDERRDRVHDARPFRASQRQDEGVGHGSLLSVRFSIR